MLLFWNNWLHKNMSWRMTMSGHTCFLSACVCVRFLWPLLSQEGGSSCYHHSFPSLLFVLSSFCPLSEPRPPTPSPPPPGLQLWTDPSVCLLSFITSIFPAVTWEASTCWSGFPTSSRLLQMNQQNVHVCDLLKQLRVWSFWTDV